MSTTSKKVLDALSGTSSSIKSLTTSIISTAISSAEDPSTTTVLGQMATSIVGSIPPPGSQSPTSCADSPNEYRNLLTSLSGQKSDHVQWIESLKQYHWEGDPEHFSFALDKCGNGDYRMNLCFDCLDLVLKSQSEGNGDSAFGGFKFLWEGNYYDHEGDTSDHAELTLDSIEVVMNKCANILREKLSSNSTDSSATDVTAKGRGILVYMPNVVQLLVSVLAAARIGAVLTFVNAAVNSKAEDLSKILEMSCAELVITVDGFFMGENLHETKKVLDEAIDLLHANNPNRIHSVFIVRHVGSNPAIPPPSKSYNGRRPHYGLEVPFIDGRDHHWSNLMVEASEQSECEWMDSEDVIFNTIKRIQEGNNDWHFEQYTVSQIALLVRMLARTIRRNRIPSLEFTRKPSCDSQHSSSTTFENYSKDEVSVVWPVVEMEDLLFLATFFAVPLSKQTLLLSESPPMHPNPSRIFQIVEKHGVNQLLLAEQYIKLLIRNEQFENVWYQESDPTWSITSLQVVYTVSKLRTENDNYVQWLSRCAPKARIIHFSC